MRSQLQQRLDSLPTTNLSKILAQSKHGLERELLRVDNAGHLSLQVHPESLGSTLSHPHITTDYAEALIEFVSAPFTDKDKLLQQLDALQLFTYHKLAARDEMLWPCSMPCILLADQQIPIAEYGSSNQGLVKHIYRRGLGLRYGRKMQTISGIHYNFSLPESFWALLQFADQDPSSLQTYQSKAYFNLIRNYFRYGWVVLILFGASPIACTSFTNNISDRFTRRNNDIYMPYATSLRSSDIGYQNKAQAALNINYNSVEQYVTSLSAALIKTNKDFAKFGLKQDDEYQQLNINELQIEAEYYSMIRPKRVAAERPVTSLASSGVEYLELRSIDNNSELALGVDGSQIKFLELFLLFCALYPSPEFVGPDLAELKANYTKIALEGRNFAEYIKIGATTSSIAEWLGLIFPALELLAKWYDSHTNAGYYDVLQEQYAKIKAPERLPSAQILTKILTNDLSFAQYALLQAKRHRDSFLARELPADLAEHFDNLAKQSLADTAAIEVQTQKPLSQYIAEDVMKGL